MRFKSKFLLILAVFLTALNLFSQVDNNQLQSDMKYPLRLINPYMNVAPTELYGIDEITISFGPFDNYRVSTTNGFAETDIAVNPRNHLNFVGSDNRVTGFVGTPWVYYTTDGGVTWGSTAISPNQGDPAFCADSLGNFYLAVLSNGVRVYKSSDGGVSWTNLGNIVNNSQADKEWIWADQTAGPYQNHVYMAYVNFATGASVDFWRSTNNAATWSFVGNMGSGSPNPGPDIATGPNGEVYLAWYNGGTLTKRSTDGGATFSADIRASIHNTPGTIGGGGRYVLKGDIRVNGMPHICVDLSNGPRRGYIYNVYAHHPFGPDKADINCTRSTNNGASWDSDNPVRVNDDATLTDQWMADASVDSQGRLWVFWWDSRNDETNNLLTDTWGAVSTDGGLTFTNFKIGNQNFNPNSIRISQGSHYYLGDYQGISGRTITFPFYTGQGNTLHDYTAYLPDFGISFSETSDTIQPGGNSTVRVISPLLGNYSGQVSYTSVITPPPASGTINVTFSPNNTITFNGNPDSLTLNISVSGDVPLGTYIDSIRGTESSGPRTHVRTFQIVVGNPQGIHITSTEIPKIYSLLQNYPNPFNPVTNIKFGLPKTSVVSLKVFDILGREIANLVNNESLQAGSYLFDFDASNLPSGIYYYKLSAGEFSDVKKMVLVK